MRASVRCLPALLIVASILLTNCAKNAKATDVGAGDVRIAIRGKTAAPLSKARAGSGTGYNKVVAFPTVNNSFEFWYMQYAEEVTVDSLGRFDIKLPKQPRIGGTPTDANWILLLIDTTRTPRIEQVVGFVAMSDLNNSLISMPVSQASGDIELGTLSKDQDEFRSSRTIDSCSTGFTISAALLRTMARFDDGFKLMKSFYANYNKAAGTSFDMRPYYEFSGQNIPAQNQFSDPALYISADSMQYSFLFFPNHPSLTDGSLLELLPPAPIGSVTAYPCTLIAESVKAGILKTRGIPSLGGTILPGYWQMKLNGQEICTYDFGAASPLDASGHPTIPVPSLNFTTDADGRISNIELEWREWNATGNYVACDQAAVCALLGESNLRVFKKASESERDGDFSMDPRSFSSATITTSIYYPGGTGAQQNPDQALSNVILVYSIGGMDYSVQFFY